MFTLYTKPDCPNCVAAKNLLKLNDQEYTELAIGTDISREDIVEMAPGMRSAPIIYKDGTLVGTYHNLKEYFGAL